MAKASFQPAPTFSPQTQTTRNGISAGELMEMEPDLATDSRLRKQRTILYGDGKGNFGRLMSYKAGSNVHVAAF